MEKSVYPNEAVGKYLNDHFISVKVQMDSTGRDDDRVKAWYADAHFMIERYGISGFPFFLFFSPEGKIVHEAAGYKKAADLVTLAREAQDPNHQYNTLVENYRAGRKDYSIMIYLANVARALKQDRVVDSVSRDYLNNYLFSQHRDSIFTRGNIDFIHDFTRSSREEGFRIFYTYGKKIDSLMQPYGYGATYSQDLIDYFISIEEIDARLWRDLNPNAPIADKPNWHKIQNIISKKYNKDYAARTVINAQLRWYNYKKDWPEYCNTVLRKVKRYGPYGPLPNADFKWNWCAWELFLHSNDSKQLHIALAWSKRSIELSQNKIGGYMDTYANLLYKTGNAKEAIEWEKRAATLSPEDKSIVDVLNKMERGEQTWPN